MGVTRGPLGPVQVVGATGWEASRWDALAVRSPVGEVFQSHVWGELKRPLGWTPRRYVFELAGKPVAVASLQERTWGPPVVARHLHLSYLYAPRGPILLRPEPEIAAAALAGLREVARDRGVAALTIDPAWEDGSPLAGQFASAGFRPAPRQIQATRTAMIVPLYSDEKEQHRLLSKSAAHNINRARRLGATAERVDLGDPAARQTAFDDFYTMFAATGRHKGFVVRDRAYQLRQWHGLAEAKLASLWFGSARGHRLVGSLVLHCGQRLVVFQAASTGDGDIARVRPNHLLQWEILRWGARAAFTSCDLGGVDTPAAPGVPADASHPFWNLYVFKKNLGGRGVLLVPAHDHAPRRLPGLAWRALRRWR